MAGISRPATFSFVDTRGNKREGKADLKAVQTTAGGVRFGKPYQQPFSVN